MSQKKPLKGKWGQIFDLGQVKQLARDKQKREALKFKCSFCKAFFATQTARTSHTKHRHPLSLQTQASHIRSLFPSSSSSSSSRKRKKKQVPHEVYRQFQNEKK